VTGPAWPASPNIYLPIGRGGPRRRAALRLIWRWRGVSKLEGEWAEASGRLSSAWGCAELLVSELDKGKGVAARDGGGGAGRP
jgi:hypothetical protein